jgi:mannose-6-phosphate isomerase-like protein (cupin superfamily)
MEIRKLNKIKSYRTKDKSEIREIFHPTNSAIKSMSISEARVKPGEITEYHFHKKSQEVYYILEGIGLIEIEGEKKKVRVNDCIFIPAGTKHRIKNLSKKTLKILCQSHPAYSHDDTILIR